MTELGSRLKEARKEKGISLDDLQEMTKIQKRYLKNIEEGNYDSMPGKFYVRAFIKQYAEAVGLQPEELFEEYGNEVPSTQTEELPEQISRVQTRKRVAPDSVKVLNVLPRILVVAVIIAVLFLIWFVVSSLAGNNNKNKLGSGSSGNVSVQQSSDVKSSEKATAHHSSPSTETPKKSSATKEKKNSERPAGQKLEVVSSNGFTTTYKLSNTDQFKLELKTNGGQSWVQVKNSGGTTNFQKLMNDGDSQSADLSKQKEATLTIGNTANTQIFVNGKKLSYEIPVTKEVRQDIVIQFETSKPE
ncbi:helix-turn-helix domain-containing protein [Heyndrickxia acidiproducens]|uniref:helix-turn-helix domain-containing protein n=1 Tax=Heyndrickxia acidiproducens TaxID=1121084 RepID=UPI00036DFECB|nr:RodZ domain-containing protein [Heyndrickxia acidiproducens]